MTAIAAIFHRDDAPADKSILLSMLDEMVHRGSDGVHTWVSGSTALGLRELCVLPEDKGVDWPLWDGARRACIIFDGRIDNREELIDLLGNKRDLITQPDAKLVLLAYLKWGCDSFARLLGEFAFIIYEPHMKRLTAVRDPMGRRRLCYTEAGSTFLIASEEQALLSHPQVETHVNERRVAAYLAVGGQITGETYFQGIFDLLPAHWMRIDVHGITRKQYWQLPETKEYWKLKPDEVLELYREKVFAAVKSRLRGQSPAAVLLSGGLDSSALIAAAAEIAPDEAHKPVAVSWVFERLKTCDESVYEKEICAMLGLRHLQVVSDDYWPLYDRQRYTHHAVNEIFLGFFGAHWESFDRIREQGMQILLTGSGGDELFVARNYWLHDLFSSGQLSTASAALVSQLKSQPIARWIRDPSLRRLLPFNGIRRRRHIKREWLTDNARRMLPAEPRTDLLTGRSWGFDRFENCISPWKARDISIAHADAQRWSLEVLEPFRDLRLVEFALNLPAFYSYDHLAKRERPLQRDVMRHRLPESVINRPRKTSFAELVEYGVRIGAKERVRKLLTRSEAVWPEYVEREWLLSGLDSRNEAPAWGRIVWDCICLELWMDALRTRE